MPYRQLEHTADIWIEVTGTSFENLLEEAGAALFDIVGKPDSLGTMREFEFGGKSNEELLVRWLEELYSESQISGILFGKFNVSVQAGKLKGKAWGGPGSVKTEVKAVTWGRLKIWQEKDKWKARVLFDI